MFKQYLYLTTITLFMLIFTACSEDKSPTGASGSSEPEDCMSSADIEGAWKLESTSSSATLTPNQNVSVLDGWTQVTNPMNLSILLDGGTELLAVFNYLHVNSSDENIVFILSEDSYWSGSGDMFIEIECNVVDQTSCSSCASFLSYSDGTNNLDVTLDMLTSVGWSLLNGTHTLVIDAFSEAQTEATFSLVDQSTLSTGSTTSSPTDPIIITTITPQEAWNQSHMTFNSDGTFSNINTLDCNLITPGNEYSCYDEGCAPTTTEGILSGCENINCSSLTQEDCSQWTACVWTEGACSNYQEDEEILTWSLDCNNLIFNNQNLFPYEIKKIDENTITITQSISYYTWCMQQQDATIEGCDMTLPAEVHYGLSDDQIEGLILNTMLTYSLDEALSRRKDGGISVQNPLFRPSWFWNK